MVLELRAAAGAGVHRTGQRREPDVRVELHPARVSELSGRADVGQRSDEHASCDASEPHRTDDLDTSEHADRSDEHTCGHAAEHAILTAVGHAAARGTNDAGVASDASAASGTNDAGRLHVVHHAGLG